MVTVEDALDPPTNTSLLAEYKCPFVPTKAVSYEYVCGFAVYSVAPIKNNLLLVSVAPAVFLVSVEALAQYILVPFDFNTYPLVPGP